MDALVRRSWILAAVGSASFVLVTIVGLAVAARVEALGDVLTPALLIAGMFVGPVFLFWAFVRGASALLLKRRAPLGGRRSNAWGLAAAAWIGLGAVFLVFARDYRSLAQPLLTLVLWPSFAWLETMCHGFGELCGN